MCNNFILLQPRLQSNDRVLEVVFTMPNGTIIKRTVGLNDCAHIYSATSYNMVAVRYDSGWVDYYPASYVTRWRVG